MNILVMMKTIMNIKKNVPEKTKLSIFCCFIIHSFIRQLSLPSTVTYVLLQLIMIMSLIININSRDLKIIISSFKYKDNNRNITIDVENVAFEYNEYDEEDVETLI